jgi:hypothetical protein
MLQVDLWYMFINLNGWDRLLLMVLVMDMVHGYQSQWMGFITAHYGCGYGTWLSISMDGIDYYSLILVMV